MEQREVLWSWENLHYDDVSNDMWSWGIEKDRESTHSIDEISKIDFLKCRKRVFFQLLREASAGSFMEKQSSLKL